MKLGTVSALFGLLAVATAQAEVKQVAADGFRIEHRQSLTAQPEAVYGAIERVGSWWSPAHTWSGDAANMTLELRAGGCFCERWAEGESEHMRVGFVRRNQTIRLLGGLGPLQGMALHGSLQFDITPQESGSELVLSYRVSGDSLHALDALAPVVDGVLLEQFSRLGRLISHGSAEAPGSTESDR